jgi:hypothetical protein
LKIKYQAIIKKSGIDGLISGSKLNNLSTLASAGVGWVYPFLFLARLG